MSDADQHLMTVFTSALDFASAAERDAYLEQICGHDAALRARIEALLRAHAGVGRFLESGAAADTAQPLSSRPTTAAGPVAGTVVAGRYKLLELIGEGGMGAVWLAEQLEPVRRKVAIKVIKPGMDSRQVLARFEAERQALALMDHPNIARVLDGGATADGRPFIAMELVKGVPITRYCDEKRLSPRERLELFLPICQAIQHAHQKGVIHRDLKPSNVLVAPYDGRPVPKVIDFGVAKAAGHLLTDKTLFTGFGALIGTPEYMSPEQAELNNQDIDTRSDIYSLGVLLYELLTGSTPLTAKRVKEAALLEVLRVIREDEPPKPSTRLSESTASLPLISAQRQTVPAKLTKLVRGELDWIVMKALEKDRNRRYETANGLARDLQRYLADEPVQACPPSVGYRLRKFARRNKGPVLAAAIVLLTFGAGLAGTTWKWLDAEYQKSQARLAETDAEQKTRDEQAARKELQNTLYQRDIALAFHEWEHRNPVRAKQLLDDCRTAYRGWEWHYVHRLCHSDRLTLTGNADPIHQIAYSPDGRLIAGATGWYDKQKPGEVIVWDAATGKEVVTFHEHTNVVRGVAFSPDCKLLASCGLDPAVRVWDLATGRQVAAYPGRGGWMTFVAFSRDGKLLAAADGSALRIWDMAAGKEMRTIPVPGIVLSIAFSPDGVHIAGACSRPSHVRLWNLQTGKEVRTLKGHTSDLSSVAFSGDGKRLVSSGWDHKIKVWDVDAGKALFTIHDHTDVVTQVCFSPDGGLVASASWDGTVRLWDSGTEKPPLRTYRGHTSLIHSVVFSPDGQSLASAGGDHQVKVWDVLAEQEPRKLPFPDHGHPYGLAFSADGKLLAAADGNLNWKPHKTLAVYDTRTGLMVRTLAGHTSRVLGVAFNPCGPQLASASTDRTAKIWDVTTGRVLHTLNGHGGDVTGVAFSADGRRLATSSADRTVRVWDTETGRQCRAVLDGHTDVVTGVAFAPDGRIASASADSTVRLWDATDDTRCVVLHGHTAAVTGVAFRPDGRQLASASADHRLRVWDAAIGRPLLELRGHAEEVRSVAYSPQGDRLVSASQDPDTVRIWDANTGRQLLALRLSQVMCAAFSPDGRRIAAGNSHHELVQLWDAVPAQPDDPARSAAWFKYHVEKKQWDKAAATLVRIDRQLPGDANLWSTAGRIYSDAKRWNDAADAFAQARQRDVPANAWTYHNSIGQCRSQQNRGDEAIGHFTDAIRAGAPVATPWRNRADCYVATRQWERAAADYTEVINRAPDDVHLWRERGRCAAEQGKYLEAITDYTEACRRKPADVGSWYYCSHAHLAANDHDGYRRTCTGMFQRFGKVEKPSWAAWTVLTAATGPGGVADFEPLLRLEEQLVENEPKSWLCLVAQGAARYRAGQYAEAIGTLTDSCAVHRKDGNAYDWLFLAMAHHQLDKSEEARKWLTRATAWIDKALREDVADTRTPSPLPWNDRVALGALRREAEELILGKPAPETK
jgi:WD40 repeat protein/serine/threonine protein kinase/Flp pilus assembly protein TadD